MAKRESTEGKGSAEAISVYESRVLEAVEEERRRLQKALAVMGCLTFTLTYESDSTNLELQYMDSGAYADVVEVTRDLIKQALDNLDSVAVAKRRVPAGVSPQEGAEVQ